MNIFRYKIVILVTLLSLSACGSNYENLEEKARIELKKELGKYCEANNYSYCEIYTKCYSNIFYQLNQDAQYTLRLLSNVMSESEQNKFNTQKNPMDIIYSKLKDSEEKNDKYSILNYSAMLYPHNKCSSIINAQSYNISRHQNIIDRLLYEKKSLIITKEKLNI